MAWIDNVCAGEPPEWLRRSPYLPYLYAKLGGDFDPEIPEVGECYSEWDEYPDPQIGSNSPYWEFKTRLYGILARHRRENSHDNQSTHHT